MRGIDPETGEYLGQSRSAKRREALDVLELCEALVAMSRTQLSKLPIPDELMPVIEETQRIKSHIAHKRQLAFLAKQMRREDDEVIDRLRDALDEDGEAARIEAAQLHRAEQWRERLLDENDDALTELLSLYPQADRQSLRTLVRNTLEERKRNKPPRAFRELFRELRTLLASESEDGSQSDEDTDQDEFDAHDDDQA